MEIDKTSSNTSNATSKSAFYRDLTSPIFSLEESHDKVIDVQASFVPQPLWCTSLIRAAFFLFTFGSTIYSYYSWIVHFKNDVWIGYLTHISATLTDVYFALIVICSMYPHLIPQPDVGSRPNFLTRLIWGLYSFVMTYQIIITVLFWALVYNPTNEIIFSDVSLHGAFIPILLIDGFIIGKIPVRLKQVVFGILGFFLYTPWSIIHSLNDIGTSAEDRLDGDGEPLYAVLNWQDHPMVATIIVIIVLLFVIPIVFGFVWMLSVYSFCCKFDGSGRRVISINEKSDPSALL